MGKRHQASRRRSYGRRQHEIRERFDRPHEVGLDVDGIHVLDVEGFTPLRDDRFEPFELAVGRLGLRFALGD
ncbi:MAG TPA: hypothetical protein VNF73_06520 [Candidatus Saccharimonadales bacterium]|nr:hypothetical protein [Candidatus Saccharimonadales bacterium]